MKTLFLRLAVSVLHYLGGLTASAGCRMTSAGGRLSAVGVRLRMRSVTIQGGGGPGPRDQQ